MLFLRVRYGQPNSKRSSIDVPFTLERRATEEHHARFDLCDQGRRHGRPRTRASARDRKRSAPHPTVPVTTQASTLLVLEGDFQLRARLESGVHVEQRGQRLDGRAGAVGFPAITQSSTPVGSVFGRDAREW